MQGHNANPFWTQHTIHFLIHSSLGFCGFYAHSQHYSMTAPIPLPLCLSPYSSALLSQSPWHASSYARTLNVGVPRGPIPPIFSVWLSHQVPKTEHHPRNDDSQMSFLHS